MAQAQGVAVKESRKRAKVRRKEAEEAPETIEVELDVDGRTLTVTQDTVPTGIFPLPRFLRRFLD